jgi:enoyl-CoA hydratase/carnithine racemase
MSADVLKVEKDGYITWLTLNRPEKRNAMNLDVLKGLMAVFDEFDRDPDVRAIIIKGEGKGFCAGMEVASLAELLTESTADYRERLRFEIVHFQQSMSIISDCRKPVIAAIHGACIGGGVDMACCCDIRIASADAYFSVRETKLALVADLGTLQRLPLIVGEPWARELCLTGRDFTAVEARDIGFITHQLDSLEDLYDKAAELAAEITACSPLSVQGVKDVMGFSRRHGVEAGLRYVAQKNAAILICEDAMEAFAARAEKRAPVFKGR